MERRTPFERHRGATGQGRKVRHRWLVALACLLAAALLGPRRGHSSDLDGDIFEDRKLEVRFTVPEGWQLTRQTGYPSLLAFVGRKSARIALSYTRLARQQKTIQIVTDNARALEALGLRVEPPQNTDRLGRKLWHVRARTADGKRSNQQLYVPAGQVIYILTLSAPSSEIQRAQLDLDYLLASLKFKRWPLTDEGLVQEQGRQGAQKKEPPATGQAALPELSAGPPLSSEGDEEPKTKTGPQEVEDRAQGRRARRPRQPARSMPASSQPASSLPASSLPASSQPASSLPASGRPSAKTAPKLPTAGSRSQTR